MIGDPTAIPIELDPREQRMRGTAYWGDTPFDVPFISHIEGHLWTGGCATGLTLPANFDHVISLYPWERYMLAREPKSEAYHYLYDSGLPDLARLRAIVAYAVECVRDGDTLIHCQAGLNRSGLVAALVLMAEGTNLYAHEAITLLRRQRSPAVLCNQVFETWLREQP